MKIKALAALCIGIAALSCSDNGTNPKPPDMSWAQGMKLSNNEIPGWINKIDTIDGSVTPPIVATGWKEFPDDNALRNLINGGYSTYTVHGWQTGAEQTMEISWDGPQCRAYIFNFGTADSAAAMFRAMMPDTAYEKPAAIPGFDQAVAFGTELLGGGTIFAHKGNLYFELAIVGYNPLELAYATGSLFLNELFKKIN